MGCHSTRYGYYVPCYQCDELWPDDYDLNKADLDIGGDGRVVMCILADSDGQGIKEVEQYKRIQNRGKKVAWGSW